jgi:hypothetical protein
VSPGFAATTPSELPALIADFVAEPALGRPTRVALDGPAAAQPVQVADAVAAVLRSRGRPAEVIAASSYWRDASLRLEYGRTDVESFAYQWLDVPGLIREVLAPLGPGGSGEFLPALRDPATNRSVRVDYRRAAPDEIVVIAGELLLGHGLGFDVIVHLALSSGARARRTAADWSWTLPAHDRYDVDVEPDRVAGLVVRWNDPQHPAVRRT